MKINELQGKDASEEIPDEALLVEQQPEEIAEVQSDTHIAEPDTVSLKEDNQDDVPPPPTTDTPVKSDAPPAESEVASPSETEGEVFPCSKGDVSVETKEDTPPPSTTDSEVAPPPQEDVPPTTEADVPPSSTTTAKESEKSGETTENSSGVNSKGL